MIGKKHVINSSTSENAAKAAAHKNLNGSKYATTGFVSRGENCSENPEEDCSPFYAAYHAAGGSRRKMRGGVSKNVPGALYKYNDASENAAIKLAQQKVKNLGGTGKAGFKTTVACDLGVPNSECEQYGKQVFWLNGEGHGGKRKTGRRNRRK